MIGLVFLPMLGSMVYSVDFCPGVFCDQSTEASHPLHGGPRGGLCPDLYGPSRWQCRRGLCFLGVSLLLKWVLLLRAVPLPVLLTGSNLTKIMSPLTMDEMEDMDRARWLI